MLHSTALLSNWGPDEAIACERSISSRSNRWISLGYHSKRMARVALIGGEPFRPYDSAPLRSG